MKFRKSSHLKANLLEQYIRMWLLMDSCSPVCLYTNKYKCTGDLNENDELISYIIKKMYFQLKFKKKKLSPFVYTYMNS